MSEDEDGRASARRPAAVEVGFRACALWDKPELVREKGTFEVVDRYVDRSDFSRSLLVCLECGLRYFTEFYEITDWDGGADAMYSTYLPVGDDVEMADMKATTGLFGLLSFSPRIQWDHPAGQKPTLRWIR